MKAFDLYGFRQGDLETARMLIEKALGITFVGHESSYVGDYYRYGEPGGEEFVLQGNRDPQDQSALEGAFMEVGVLLYVNNPEHINEIERKLTGSVPGIELLRRELR